MEDSAIVHVGVEDQDAESFFDPDQGQNEAKHAGVNSKIGDSEAEKLELIRENQEIKEKCKKLSQELEQLRHDEELMKERLEVIEREVDGSEEDSNIIDSITARAVELETEVCRLQQDLVQSMSEVDEANREIEDMKEELQEKGVRVVILEKEIEGFKKGKAENEKMMRELERKLGLLEMKEMQEKSKKMRVEEEMRDRIGEKEKEIGGLRKNVEDLENEVVKSRMELENSKNEKKLVELALRGYEERVSALELKLLELQKEVVTGARERTADGMNGKVDEIVDGVEDEGPEFKGLPLGLQLGSAGAVVVATAVVFYFYNRRT